jgi:uncharacterized protein YndB with AHSA1/START domain
VRHARVSIEVGAAGEKVWRLISEFEHWPAWGPSVLAVESEAAAVEPGVTGRVKTVAGFWLPFEITAVEPGRSWNWKVAGIPATGHRVEDIGDGSSRVEFTAPIVTYPYVLVLRRGLVRLKQLAESRL